MLPGNWLGVSDELLEGKLVINSSKIIHPYAPVSAATQ